MANVLRRTGPWMAVAVVLMGGFMYWLYSASSSIESEIAAADTTEAEGVNTVADSAFANNPLRFANRRVILRPVTVQERLGRAALTIALPGGKAYPIILDRTLLESNLTVVEGDNVLIAGQVFALNDSILDIWAQRGIYESENRAKLEGDSTFLMVDSLDFVFPEQEQGTPQQG